MDESLQIQETEVFEEIGRMHMMQVKMSKAISERDKQIKELVGNDNNEGELQ